MVWNFSFKSDFSCGKNRSRREPNKGAESPEWFDVLPEKLCVRCDTWVSMLLWWSCHSPVAHSCSLLNHLNNFFGRMFKNNTTFDADSLLYFLRHFECDGHTIHILTQWHLLPPLTSTMRLSLFMHVHSSPLSLAARLDQCYTNRSP